MLGKLQEFQYVRKISCEVEVGYSKGIETMNIQHVKIVRRTRFRISDFRMTAFCTIIRRHDLYLFLVCSHSDY